jgi:hypothetical protein
MEIQGGLFLMGGEHITKYYAIYRTASGYKPLSQRHFLFGLLKEPSGFLVDLLYKD